MPSTVKFAGPGAVVAIAVAAVALVAGSFTLGLTQGRRTASPAARTNAEATNAPGSAAATEGLPAEIHYKGVIVDMRPDALLVALPDKPAPNGDMSLVSLDLRPESVLVARVLKAPTSVAVPAAGDKTAVDGAPQVPNPGEGYKDIAIAQADLMKLDLVEFTAKVQKDGDAVKLIVTRLTWLAHVVREPKKNEIPQVDVTNRFEKAGERPVVPLPEGTDTAPLESAGNPPPPPPPGTAPVKPTP